MKKTIEGFAVSEQARRFLCIGGAITLFDWGKLFAFGQSIVRVSSSRRISGES